MKLAMALSWFLLGCATALPHRPVETLQPIAIDSPEAECPTTRTQYVDLPDKSFFLFCVPKGQWN
jgi:hypothetical protein